MARIKILVVIPTYNEKDSLPEIAPQVLNLKEDVGLLIVDDASPDGTGQVAETLARNYPQRMWVLHRTGKNGLGSAYLDGFRWGISKLDGVDYFVQMDADGSHDPEAVLSLTEAAKSADLVIGSRYLNGIRILDWPMRRLLLSYISNLVTRYASGLPLTDCTSGFKCFRRATVEKILTKKIDAMSYDFQVEVNANCLWNRFKLVEVPITFHNRTQGNSKLTRADVVRAALMVSKLGFRRFLPLKLRSPDRLNSASG